jgi:hypothetical protein
LFIKVYALTMNGVGVLLNERVALLELADEFFDVMKQRLSAIVKFAHRRTGLEGFR